MRTWCWLTIFACAAHAASLPVTESKATVAGVRKRWVPPEEKYFRKSHVKVQTLIANNSLGESR